MCDSSGIGVFRPIPVYYFVLYKNEDCFAEFRSWISRLTGANEMSGVVNEVYDAYIKRHDLNDGDVVLHDGKAWRFVGSNAFNHWVSTFPIE